jgi:lactonase
VAYHFTGFAPDSLRADSAGNVYVAMYSQGRVLVCNPSGVPIGQILIPTRESGHNMRTTCVGFFPGTDDMVILTNDGDGGEGAWILGTPPPPPDPSSANRHGAELPAPP